MSEREASLSSPLLINHFKKKDIFTFSQDRNQAKLPLEKPIAENALIIRSEKFSKPASTCLSKDP